MSGGGAQNMRLTSRESAVLRLLARGRTYAQVAEELGISLHTVTTHIKSAYRKLQVHSAAAAVMRAIELGLLGEVARSPEHGMGGGGGGS